MSLDTEMHLSRMARRAVVAIALLGGSAVIWGGFIPIEGAVVAQGTVVVDGAVKKVQHQTGGTIGAILVKEGTVVNEGDVVARLDNTLAKSNLGVIMADLGAQQARSARLIAERDDGAQIQFPAELLARARSDAGVAIALDSERKLFDTRRGAREGNKTQLRERLSQVGKEKEGLELQFASIEQQLDIAQKDRAMLEPLIRSGLVQRPRYTQLDREVERNKGLIGDTRARIEQAALRIKETEVQIAQVDRDRLAESNKELREAEARVDELSQRRVAAEDQLRRTDILAPASGTVHELAANTVGGVVNPGDALMQIVPTTAGLLVEVRVAPNDIDQILKNSQARVRLAAFNQRITPELQATVTRIAGNSSRDPQSGVTFFTVGLSILEDQFAKLNGHKLMPGMLADSFIATEKRTVLEYLTKQFFDYMALVFRGR